jgi:glycosyltransferase involved in cell wall biosynthesis
LTRIVIVLFHIDVAVAEGATAAAIGARHGIPVICDFQGDIVEELKLVSASQWQVRLVQEDELLACREAVGWVCVSDALAQVLRGRHGAAAPAAVVPCGVDIRKFAGYEERRERARARLGVSDRWVVCYLGGLHKYQQIPRTLSLVGAMRAREPRLFFLFLTQDASDSYAPELSVLGDEGRDYARLALTHSEVVELLPAADLGLLLRAPSPVNYVSSPTKCGEYLASGVPVLTTAHAGDAPRIVSETNTGLVLHGETDAPDVAELALSFLQTIMANRADVATRSHLAARRYHDSLRGRENLGSLFRELIAGSLR